MAGFKVIIVGGGIGGLTLANCLEHAGIDFVLLEGREKIGLHVGAGVGLEANGDRILDQLDVRKDLLPELVPNRCFIFRNVQGKHLYTKDYPLLSAQRTGYFPWIYERTKLLEALHNRLRNKDKVVVQKKVEKIEYEGSKVVVLCTDKTRYDGDLVVGSDGVHSVVRNEMWRISDLKKPTSIPESERNYLSAEYRGLYGISDPIKGIDEGTMTLVLGIDQLCYWMVGKDGRIYWCLVEKLPEKVQPPNLPRYTDEDAVAYAEARLEKVIISDTMNLVFGDLWKRRRVYSLVLVEEGNLDTWFDGRIVCIGDAVHKMTPESGQGANQSIETAASLANHLKQLVDDCPKKSPSLVEVQECLKRFQAHRKPRARAITSETMRNVRILTLRTTLLRFISNHLVPRLGDLQVDQICARYVGAERIDYLPIPAQSITGTMPFNSSQGITQFESRKTRALTALWLILMALLGVLQSLKSREKSPNTLSIVDQLPIYFIWVMEGCRRANHLKPIVWTLPFILLSYFYGIAVPGSIWFFLYYVWSPIEVYAASDERLFQMNYARAALPSIVLTATIPVLIRMLDSLNPIEERILRLLPIFLTISHRIFAIFLQDTTPHDRLYNVKADIPYIQRATLGTGILAIVLSQFLGHGFSGSFSPKAGLYAWLNDPQLISIYAGGLIWLGLLFWDLAHAKMIEKIWLTLLMYSVITVVVLGPGPALLVGWAWREKILASKIHFGAITQVG